MKGYHNCMRICNENNDCAGFTHYPTFETRYKEDGFDEINWAEVKSKSSHRVKSLIEKDFCFLRKSINPINPKHITSDCYEKLKGN